MTKRKESPILLLPEPYENGPWVHELILIFFWMLAAVPLTGSVMLLLLFTPWPALLDIARTLYNVILTIYSIGLFASIPLSYFAYYYARFSYARKQGTHSQRLRVRATFWGDTATRITWLIGLPLWAYLIAVAGITLSQSQPVEQVGWSLAGIFLSYFPVRAMAVRTRQRIYRNFGYDDSRRKIPGPQSQNAQPSGGLPEWAKDESWLTRFSVWLVVTLVPELEAPESESEEAKADSEEDSQTQKPRDEFDILYQTEAFRQAARKEAADTPRPRNV